MSIDRNNYTPLYVQLYQLMKKEICSYAPGTMLPPEKILCEKYDLDRVTVRKTMAMLVDEGLIERHKGRGTFVLQREEPVSAGDKGVIMFVTYSDSYYPDRASELFYARSIDELNMRFRTAGKQLIYSKVLSGVDLASFCKQSEVDGVILSGHLESSVIEECSQMAIPVVTYNCRCSSLPYVVSDHENGAQLIAEHLMKLGHRRVGFVRVPGNIDSELHLEKFQRTYRERGLADPIIAEGDWSDKSGYVAGLRLLADPENRPTAIFAGNDSMALGVMRAVAGKGLRIPEDVSVAGYDGIEKSSLASPTLTTIQTNIPAMAEATFMMLSHMIHNGKSADIGVVVSVKLMERSSTGLVTL